jgi:hypothetical protein
MTAPISSTISSTTLPMAGKAPLGLTTLTALPSQLPSPYAFTPTTSPNGVTHPSQQVGSFGASPSPQALAIASGVKPLAATAAAASPAINPAKQWFNENKAVVYALNVRTFGTMDRNRDGQISFSQGETGSFVKAAAKLDELKKLGVNVIHILPVTQSGRLKRLGTAGSIYAMSDPSHLNKELDDPRLKADIESEARWFVQQAHAKGIRVMIDLPSCVAKEVESLHPELIIRDKEGKVLVPANWIDIMMLKKGGPGVEQFFAPFFDLMVNRIGVDGIRADVARARSGDFWEHVIQQQYPNLAWLGETYTEQAAPITNIPRDVPEDLLRNGFDSIYGQFHIFHHWDSAGEYQKYLTDNYWMLRRAGKGKSFIGSFLTHDDVSLMPAGGALQYHLSSGLMATQPWTNPYILDGYTTGYDGEFDIFNYSQRPTGKHPEIGQFLSHIMALRQQTGTPASPELGDLMSKGYYIPLPVKTGDRKNQIIAFARHLKGKTLVVIANKDVNARHAGTVNLPGLLAEQTIQNLAPDYGQMSRFEVNPDTLTLDLGPGRFHMFMVDTPRLLQTDLPAYPGLIEPLAPKTTGNTGDNTPNNTQNKTGATSPQSNTSTAAANSMVKRPTPKNDPVTATNAVTLRANSPLFPYQSFAASITAPTIAGTA